MADQDGSDASPPESQASYSQYISEDGHGSSGSGKTYTPNLTPTPGPTLTHTTTSPSYNAATKTDSLLFNKIDERQRLARERRGEREKLNAVKEAEWQAREERARLHYEKQVEERRRRLEEQRVKEDRRRVAVEEKRRQKLEEDKARHEAVIRRSLERTQRTKQKPNRWSWGGPLQTNAPSTPADAERRSVSTMNLSKHTDPVITKRLSYSSATLLHSPDRGLRRLPLTPWESNVVNRLQQPTHSYLARSRSAMSLSGEQTAMPVCPRSVSCHPMGSMSFQALQAPPLPHCRSQERSLGKGAVSSSTTTARRRTTGTTISSPPAYKPSAGTTDPEEASRILAENRRLARGQREREEEERKLAQEEMARRKAEERAKREEEAQRQAEEAQRQAEDTRKNKEEEERKGEEERLQKGREEAERLQKQKEEEESRQRKEAEQVRQEREKHFQKEEAERLERKKVALVYTHTHTHLGRFTANIIYNMHVFGVIFCHIGGCNEGNIFLSIFCFSRENGEFEEVIVLPSHSRLSPPEGEEEQQQVEERVPVLAFTENGLLKPLSGVEDISAQQGPGQ
uniref:Ensconsin n=1 Tax=Cyclopterus lumpus TaxID=8103 RepID=A0A8C2ZTJ4_CYCLU